MGMAKRKEKIEISGTNGGAVPSDALVLFGATGDLVYKKIFPALYVMAKRGVLNGPVVGVATSKLSLAQLRKRATESIKKSGKIDDTQALSHLLSLLRYVAGDYTIRLRTQRSSRRWRTPNAQRITWPFRLHFSR